MNQEQPSPLWLRFVVAGQRLRNTSPTMWPLVVQLVEGAAEPDSLTTDDLRELATIAAHTAWASPPSLPASGPPVSPARALNDWRLVDHEALGVSIGRMEMLTPESVAAIAHWARGVARARREPNIACPPRPPVVDQLLVEVQTSADQG